MQFEFLQILIVLEWGHEALGIIIIIIINYNIYSTIIESVWFYYTLYIKNIYLWYTTHYDKS